MGLWGDIVGFFDTIGRWLVDAIVGGLTWLKDTLAALRGEVTKALVASMSNPWGAFWTILSITITTVAIQAIYDALKKQALWIAVETFFTNLGNLILDVTKFLHLDTILMLSALSDTFITDFHNALLPIYKAFSDLSVELEMDASFILVFAETNRAILHAYNSILPGGGLKAELAYSEGLATWLSGLKTKLAYYVTNPQAIWLDMASIIAQSRAKEADDNAVKLWAAIDFSSKWIVSSGESLITLVRELDLSIGKLPKEIQDSIKLWWTPMKKDFDDFVKLTWDPFHSSYTDFTTAVNDAFMKLGIDIKGIEATIKNPIDFLRMILLWPEKERDQSLDDLDDLIKKAEMERNQTFIESATEIYAPLGDKSLLLPVKPPEPQKVTRVDLPDTVEITETASAYESPFELAIIGESRTPGSESSWYIGVA